jgi:CubicO group peptidase (beta-lactamase class C family)
MPRPLRLAAFAVLIALPAAVACGEETDVPPRPPAEPQPAQPEPPAAAPERPAAPPDFELTLERAWTFETLRTIHIAQRGEVVEAESYNNASLDAAANIKSASKSLVSALVGIAI